MFAQTAPDEDGRPVRDEGSTTYAGAIETAEEFGLRRYTEAWRLGWSRADKEVSANGSKFLAAISGRHIQCVFRPMPIVSG